MSREDRLLEILKQIVALTLDYNNKMSDSDIINMSEELLHIHRAGHSLIQAGLVGGRDDKFWSGANRSSLQAIEALEKLVLFKKPNQKAIQ